MMVRCGITMKPLRLQLAWGPVNSEPAVGHLFRAFVSACLVLADLRWVVSKKLKLQCNAHSLTAEGQ
jgi:hypothetical protein